MVFLDQTDWYDNYKHEDWLNWSKERKNPPLRDGTLCRFQLHRQVPVKGHFIGDARVRSVTRFDWLLIASRKKSIRNQSRRDGRHSAADE